MVCYTILLHVGLYSLLNHRSLKLCEDPHHAEERSAGRRRMDALPMQIEINLIRMDLGAKIGQMG